MQESCLLHECAKYEECRNKLPTIMKIKIVHIFPKTIISLLHIFDQSIIRFGRGKTTLAIVLMWEMTIVLSFCRPKSYNKRSV